VWGGSETEESWESKIKKSRLRQQHPLFLRSHVFADWLQVHAVDEVIRLLCGEGAGFLNLVSNESESTADHEQQQRGDDEAESQRQDRTFRRKRIGN